MMIPFSVEFEARLWELRENPSAKQVGVGPRSPGQGTCLAAITREQSFSSMLVEAEQQAASWWAPHSA